MINITKVYELENLTGAFTHEWILPDCVTLISSVVLDNTITATFDFCDNECLLNFNQIGLKIIDADGCITTIDSVFEDVCAELKFTQGGITSLEDCDGCTIAYKAPTNEAGITYQWIVDSEIFTTTSINDRVELEYVDGAFITTTSTPLKVIATNKYGCSVEHTIDIAVCINEEVKYNFDIVCRPRAINTSYTTSNISLGLPCSKAIDYSTVEFLQNQPGLVITTAEESFKISTYQISLGNNIIVVPMKAKDCAGYTTFFTLCLQPIQCTTTPTIIPYNHTFGCQDCIDRDLFRSVASNRGGGDDVCLSNLSINLEDLVEGNVDWTSFTFIPSLGQTLVTNTNMLTPHGELNLTINREVLYTYSGGLVNVEFVNYSLLIDGVLTTGRLEFQGTQCGSTPVAVDNDVCMLSDGTSGYIDITANDSGAFTELIITQYPNVQTLVNGNTVNFIAGGFVGTTVLKYKLRNEAGVESNQADVIITVADANLPTSNISICLNDVIDLNSLVTSEELLPWSFIGYTTEVTDIPGTLNSPEFIVGDIIGNPNVVFNNAGIYTFQFGESGPCNAFTTVNIEVIASEQSVDLDTSICVTDANTVNLNTLANVTGGTWTDLNQTNVLNPDGVTIIADVTPGAYSFRYNITNTGIYNETGCSNTFILTLDIQEEPVDVPTQCLVYCSYGPDPALDASCTTNPVIVNNTATTGCEYDLYTEMGLPAGSKIQLLTAPYTPIFLNINGSEMLFNAGSFLPEGIALWDNGKAPLGTYLFRAFYGDACPKEVDFEVNIYQASCVITDTTIVKCNTDPEFNIFNEINGGSNCLDNNFTSLVLISENLAGEGIPDYNLTTGDFNPTVPGQWVFTFTSTVTGTDGTCSACNTDATITITVTPLPGSGVPQPGAVCNDGACVVDVYPDMFTPNTSIIGTFCYDGFSTVAIATPGTGGWGGVEPTLTPGDISGPSYTFEGAAVGFYFFSNKVTVDGCTSISQTVVQVVSAGTAGNDIGTQLVCELEPECLILRDLLVGEDAGGVWSAGGDYTIAFNNCNPGLFILGDVATFNTDSMPVGTYTFTYSVSTPNNIYPIFDGCVSCGGAAETITIIITEAVSAGNGSSQMVCS